MDTINAIELESPPLNSSYIFKVSAVAALGGLLFGFDTAVISGALSLIQSYFQLKEVALGWAVSCILLGCAVGALVAGEISDYFGRKKVLFLCGIVFAATGIGAGLSTSFGYFIFFRMSGGLAVGAAAMVAPMYIAETVPAVWRGRLVSLYQLAIVAGILLAYLSNYFFISMPSDGWRWMFASQALPALIFMLSLSVVPETPRWLISKNRELNGIEILKKIGGDEYAGREFVSIKQSFISEGTIMLKDFFATKYRRVLILGMTIAVFQQITGINAILYYAPEIFKQTGVSMANALLQTIGVGMVMFIFTLLAIGLIDRVGRRILLSAGALLMAAALAVVATCFYLSYFQHYIVFIFIIIYIAGFSASLGAVTWVLLAEIFPNRIRASALSFTTLGLWIADFVASFSFPVLRKTIGDPFTLMLFSLLCFVYFFFLRFMLPETKNKTLEELEKIFVR